MVVAEPWHTEVMQKNMKKNSSNEFEIIGSAVMPDIYFGLHDPSLTAEEMKINFCNFYHNLTTLGLIHSMENMVAEVTLHNDIEMSKKLTKNAKNVQKWP